MIPRFTFESDGYLHGIVSKSLILPCNHIGIPKPTIKWFKDDNVEENNEEKFFFKFNYCLDISYRTQSNDD